RQAGGAVLWGVRAHSPLPVTSRPPAILVGTAGHDHGREGDEGSEQERAPGQHGRPRWGKRAKSSGRGGEQTVLSVQLREPPGSRRAREAGCHEAGDRRSGPSGGCGRAFGRVWGKVLSAEERPC